MSERSLRRYGTVQFGTLEGCKCHGKGIFKDGNCKDTPSKNCGSCDSRGHISPLCPNCRRCQDCQKDKRKYRNLKTPTSSQSLASISDADRWCPLESDVDLGAFLEETNRETSDIAFKGLPSRSANLVRSAPLIGESAKTQNRSRVETTEFSDYFLLDSLTLNGAWSFLFGEDGDRQFGSNDHGAEGVSSTDTTKLEPALDDGRSWLFSRSDAEAIRTGVVKEQVRDTDVDVDHYCLQVLWTGRPAAPVSGSARDSPIANTCEHEATVEHDANNGEPSWLFSECATEAARAGAGEPTQENDAHKDESCSPFAWSGGSMSVAPGGVRVKAIASPCDDEMVTVVNDDDEPWLFDRSAMEAARPGASRERAPEASADVDHFSCL